MRPMAQSGEWVLRRGAGTAPTDCELRTDAAEHIEMITAIMHRFSQRCPNQGIIAGYWHLSPSQLCFLAKDKLLLKHILVCHKYIDSIMYRR